MKAANDPTDYAAVRAGIPDFSGRLESALQRIAQPVAAYAGFALGVAAAEPVRWLCRHTTCPCARMQPGAMETPDGVDLIEVVHRSVPAGSVILCTQAGEKALAPIVRNLIQESVRLLELEYDDEDLLRELGSNWESLHSLYEISTDLRNSRNIPDILGRILDRIVAIKPSLHAVLWIEREGRLEPAAARRAEVRGARNMRDGILGRALKSRTPMIINGRAFLTDPECPEPELSHADSVTVVPIATQDRLVGALEVWQEPYTGEFDTPTIRLFEALALQAALVVESERAHQISLEEERLRGEFEIGGKIQETLLLGRPPTSLPALDIGVLTVPSHSVDGDFFDFLPCGDDCLDLFIGDVMGKGVPAALVAAAAKSDLLRVFGQLTAANLNRTLPEPKDIVTTVHRQLTGQLIGLESFLSLYYCRFDLRHRRLDFVDCGHPHAIHYRADSGMLEVLAGDNLPLGVVEGGNYTQASVQFDPGDLFFFYSDGVTEAHTPDWELFGEERLKACVRDNAAMEPGRLCHKVRESVSAHTGSPSVSDDLTCLCIRIGRVEERIPTIRWVMEFSSHLEFLPVLRSWIRGAYRCAGIKSGRTLDALELAVTETASNIIRHAYGGLTGKKIIIEAEVLADRLAVTLSHWGSRFRPGPGSPAIPDSAMEHGYGLYIISQVMDGISYFEGPNGTDCIRLEKFLRK